FMVSNLDLPGAQRPWESRYGAPDRIASALEIMLSAPLGAADFNNEFGRPSLTGFFRTFELSVQEQERVQRRGYHKPIMIAGGLGTIREPCAKKAIFEPETLVVVLGGPAMRIGLGGGSASSVASGSLTAELDFASVQRGNPEMQRRCQEVIDRCAALGEASPIASIHDVGAGGLSNALPELVHDAGRGAEIRLKSIPNADFSMNALELWCNEAQERYVLAIAERGLATFDAICRRERAPYAVVGRATRTETLRLEGDAESELPVDLPLSVVFGNPPKLRIEDRRIRSSAKPFDAERLDLAEALRRVLLLPTVADKSFLVTICDRSVGGLTVRGPMVGRMQVPVADVAVTAASFSDLHGEAMAIGERPPIALVDAPASARMAVGEALLNLWAAPVRSISDIRLSANWMAASGHPGENARLYDAVKAIGMALCPELHIAIPVGKDSMSMRTVWQEQGHTRSVVAPLSLVVTAFAPVTDIRRVTTPELNTETPETALWLFDLGAQKNRLGGSALAQVFGEVGAAAPDIDSPDLLRRTLQCIRELQEQGLILAYHDRSDGGMIVAALEMAFAGATGVTIEMDQLAETTLAPLFSEELGALAQIADEAAAGVILNKHGVEHAACRVGRVRSDRQFVVARGAQTLYSASLEELRSLWSDTSFQIQSIRDEPRCAREEQSYRCDFDRRGLFVDARFEREITAPSVHRGKRPRVAILREQGVNGHIEMAAAFDRAGFESVDVHMTEILSGRSLNDFEGIAACGGFSYGDVLGAGLGWAKSILFHAGARRTFESFFKRKTTFTLGVCNGCQMLAGLKTLIEGAEDWPSLKPNRSGRFEGRTSMVRISKSPSVLLQSMEDACLPVAVAHGEGRVHFGGDADRMRFQNRGLIAARYIDDDGSPTERYPCNPNGSPGGITAWSTLDGRVTAMMPHPERVFLEFQNSWRSSASEGESQLDVTRDGQVEATSASPWLRLFENARVFVGS
ncbi:MAG: phosphoribosylformylglycinamidine synthase, partial [Myxococcota bacterium]